MKGKGSKTTPNRRMNGLLSSIQPNSTAPKPKMKPHDPPTRATWSARLSHLFGASRWGDALVGDSRATASMTCRWTAGSSS